MIITPAYNEADYIRCTIESVLVQSIMPQQWIIVDDGSTDDTAKIIQRYAKENDWIHYIYREKQNGQSYFSSNVDAIMEGFNHIHNNLNFIYNK